MTCTDHAPKVVLDKAILDLGGKRVVDEMSLTIRHGDRVALVGASGCGKTTLLRLIGGLLTPDQGTVRSTFRAPAFVFQDPRLLPWRSAVDNVRLAVQQTGRGPTDTRQLARDMLRDCGLDSDHHNKFPAALSGGMRARVSLARALLHAPDLLLCDEPFGSLDIGTRYNLQQRLLQRMRNDAATMVLVTHDLNEAVILCNRIVVLSRLGAEIVWDTMLPSLDPQSGFDERASLAQSVIADLLNQNPVRRALFGPDPRAENHTKHARSQDS